MEDKKFCAGCQKWRLLSEGQTVVRNKRNRWICNVCLARKNDSPYTTRIQHVNKLEIKMYDNDPVKAAFDKLFGEMYLSTSDVAFRIFEYGWKCGAEYEKQEQQDKDHG